MSTAHSWHPQPQQITKIAVCPPSFFFILRMFLKGSNSYESLFQCAASVPSKTIESVKPREISVLRYQNTALHMRCCGFLPSYCMLLRNLKGDGPMTLIATPNLA